MLVDVIAESVLDTLELVPFLFVTYLAMEALEHSTGGRMQGLVARAGHAGPVVGALLGAIPQCGFSAMAATLFSGGVVTVGTLVAVIVRHGKVIVPFGNDAIEAGDSVVIIACESGISDLNEVIRK